MHGLFMNYSRNIHIPICKMYVALNVESAVTVVDLYFLPLGGQVSSGDVP